MSKDGLTETRTGKFEPYILTDTDKRALQIEIEQALEDICQECGFDAEKVTQNQWNYTLKRIHEIVLQPRPEILRIPSPTTGQYERYSQVIAPNLYTLYDIYKELCLRYNHFIQAVSFEYISGVTADCITWWEKRGKVRDGKSGFAKRIRADQEQSMTAAMLADKGNPVKYIAFLNHFHSWDKDRPTDTEDAVQRVEAKDLTRISLQKKSDNLSIPDFSKEDDID